MLEKRFDFVFSLGEDCGCAMHLRKFGLRIMSSPFDWVNGASFETRINLLCNNFEGFLSKDKLVYKDYSHKATLRDCANDIYYDKGLGFNFIHDFATSIPLDKSYPTVRERYDRRIKRTLDKIRSSRHVLIVWWSRDKIISAEEIASSIARLKKAFPINDINLMVCQNAPKGNASVSFEQIGDFGVRVVGPICPDLNKTDGDIRINKTIFKRIRVVRSIICKRLLIKSFYKFFGIWHISHSERRKARQRLKRLAEGWLR